MLYRYPGFPGVGEAVAALLVSAALLVLLRVLLGSHGRPRGIGKGLLIVGGGELAHSLYRELAGSEPSPSIRRVVTRASGIASPAFEPGAALDYRGLRDLVLRNEVSKVVVADADASEELTELLIDCKLRGVEVEEAAVSYEKRNSKVWLEALRPERVVYSDGFHPSRAYLALKRAVDVVFALLLIAVTSPLMALIAIAIKADSPGSVFLRQERVGLGGRTFDVMKFRSMRNDAEAGTGPVWAREHDDRITAVGAVLRKFRLDEIPQAFNVLRGEMSFVGPRPERPFFVRMLRQRMKYYDLRHHVKPGITGWAQVRYLYCASIEDAYEKLQYDLYYIKHMSFWTDVRIVLQTLRVVVFGRGR